MSETDTKAGAAARRALSETTRRKPEVLAPAGDADSLVAALRAGADAVYFGLDVGFNARARARNFTLEGLRETVAAVHLAGAKVYLTLNTLVFEPELRFVESLLREVARAGVDAIIVQDPAVCLLAREICPALHVHASTQMTISSPLAARFAEGLGVTRVVLPRELSIAEIEAFRRATGVEVEVFVHGALCVSWSGQCLTSEAKSGRSANRGQCAQSCRLPYVLEVDGERQDLGDVRYLLSPKDLAGARAVPELARLGVAGLKIEGRQKGEVYVASAVKGYRRLVDAIAAHETGGVAEAEREFRGDLLAMTLAFSRGFSDGFLAGSDHQSLVDGRFPKHRGVCLGRVERVSRNDVVVVPERETGDDGAGDVSAPLDGFGGARGASGPVPEAIEVRAGMGVVFDAGHPEDKTEPGGKVFGVERRGASIVLRFGDPGPDLARVLPGHRVWVTSDPAVQRGVEKEREQGLPVGRLPIALRVEGRLGASLKVRGESRGFVLQVASDAPLEAARGAGLDAALLNEKLASFGGTPFHLDGLAALDVSGLETGLHLPVSELKGLRRTLVASLAARIANGPQRPIDERAEGQVVESLRERLRAGNSSRGGARGDAIVLPLCRSEAQFDAAVESGCPEVELDFLDLVGLRRVVERARAQGVSVTIATLRVEKPLEDRFFDAVASLAPDGILVRHWSGLVRAADRSPHPALHGDFSLNVTNSLTALHLLSSGLTTLTPGYDLDSAQLHALLDAAPAERFTIALWHRVPEFHTEHCVYSHLLSQGRDYRSCGRPCESRRVSLIDDAGHDHPIIVDAGCRNTVFDGRAQSVAALVPGLLERGVSRFRVELLRESREEAASVLGLAGRLVAGALAPNEFLRRTGARPRIGIVDGRTPSMTGSREESEPMTRTNA